MTRDGLVERNETTGAVTSASQRNEDIDLRNSQKQGTPGHSTSGSAKREPTRGDVHKKQSGTKYHKRFADNDTRPDQAVSDQLSSEAAAYDTVQSQPDPLAAQNGNSSGIQDQESRSRHTENAIRFPDTAQSKEQYSGERPETENDSNTPQSDITTDKNRSAPERPDRLRFEDENQPSPSAGGAKSRQRGTAYHRRFSDDAASSADINPEKTNPSCTAPAEMHSPDSRSDAKDIGENRPQSGGRALNPDRTRLQFTKDEAPPDPSPDGKLEKARRKAEKSATKLEKAEKKLPTKRKIQQNKDSGVGKEKPKRKFHFEKEDGGRLPVKSQHEHIKGALPLRPVKAGLGAATGFAHKKVYQVERENAGVEAAHKGEVMAEGAVHRIYHAHKTRPYRRVEKLQRSASKRAAKYSYQKTLRENLAGGGTPKLKSNILSRMAQKRKIKRQYAKAAREAQRMRTASKSIGASKTIASRAVAVVRRHPVVYVVIAVLFLLIILISSVLGSCSSMATGGATTVLASSYLAENADIDNSELYYTELETDLQLQIGRAEQDNPGYDEYRFQVDDIGHNPFELMAFLTAVYSHFQYADVQSVLDQIFSEQYTLSTVLSVETRYTEDDNGEQTPYDWNVLTVTVTSRSFTDVIYPRMSEDQQKSFTLLMHTKGNRQLIKSPFETKWLPYVTDYYGYRVHPVSGEKNYHKGIDIGIPAGTDIHAGHDGKVTTAAFDADGFGNYVVIEGGNGLVTKYAHCDSLLVSVGQEVKAGDVIAKSGNTGNSTGPHLHLEIVKDGQYLNPIYFAQTNDDGSGYIPGSPGGPAIPDYSGEPMGDGTYAAMIKEAEKYLGYPYVWGGSSPSTSFDCSGYVSWVINQSGVASVGRLGATGLYNICTPVSKENAKPGDLIFFHSTYSTTALCSHVGIYVGDGQMIHCGNPIQYTSINTSYWQKHFFAFGRLN